MANLEPDECPYTCSLPACDHRPFLGGPLALPLLPKRKYISHTSGATGGYNSVSPPSPQSGLLQWVARWFQQKNQRYIFKFGVLSICVLDRKLNYGALFEKEGGEKSTARMIIITSFYTVHLTSKSVFILMQFFEIK